MKKDDNKLIAEFMGLVEPYELPQHGTIRPNGDFKTGFTSAQLKYHTSWEWLMPVVGKCDSLSFYKQGESDIVWGKIFNDNDVVRAFQANEIDIVYRAVVEFIKWYNEQEEEDECETCEGAGYIITKMDTSGDVADVEREDCPDCT
jgi:hypothetical protein